MKRWGIAILVILVLVIGIVVVKGRVGFFSESGKISVAFVTPTPTPDPMAPKNILVLGYGGGTHDGALLTDTMIVVHIVPKTHDIMLISLPRDLWVPLPLIPGGVVEDKINSAYAHAFDRMRYLERGAEYTDASGAGNLAMYAAREVTGMTMDGYIAVSFEGFKSVLSTLGPVSVTVPYTFEDTLYPIDGKEKDTCGKSPEEMNAVAATASGDLLEQQYTCRYETIKFDKGTMIMDAETALKFVRSRHSKTNPGDFYRSIRQQALIQGVIAKLKTIGGMVKIPALIPSITKFVTTNITGAQVLEMIGTYGDPLNFHIGRISLTDDTVVTVSTSSDGQYILTPTSGNGFDSIKQYIQDQLATITATPSATPTGQE